jgi:hypothetical protein
MIRMIPYFEPSFRRKQCISVSVETGNFRQSFHLGQLLCDTLSDREPMKLPEKRLAAGSSTGLRLHSSEGILRPLEFVDRGRWSTVQQGVAVVEPGCHNAARNGCRCVCRHEPSNMSQRTCVIRAGFDDRTDVRIKAKTAVNRDAKGLQLG